jgi:hypothetical protein
VPTLPRHSPWRSKAPGAGNGSANAPVDATTVVVASTVVSAFFKAVEWRCVIAASVVCLVFMAPNHAWWPSMAV